jgi:hypothetical protein
MASWQNPEIVTIGFVVAMLASVVKRYAGCLAPAES